MMSYIIFIKLLEIIIDSVNHNLKKQRKKIQAYEMSTVRIKGFKEHFEVSPLCSKPIHNHFD